MHEMKETICEVLAPSWDDSSVSFSSFFTSFRVTHACLLTCSAAQAKPSRPFEFPDGYNSQFSSLRLQVPEILFNPSRFLPQEVSLSRRNHPSQLTPILSKQFTSRPAIPSQSTIASHPPSALLPLQRLISNSLVQIDPDLQSTLLGNIVVTGGTTLLPGFIDRLQNELQTLAPGMKIKIRTSLFPVSRGLRLIKVPLG